MKIVIIGANGRLGSDVLAEFQLAGEQPVGVTYEDMDVSSLESSQKSLIEIHPTLARKSPCSSRLSVTSVGHATKGVRGEAHSNGVVCVCNSVPHHFASLSGIDVSYRDKP
jgi:RmlD substrate binding domain